MWSLVVLWCTRRHHHVRIWLGFLPPESEDKLIENFRPQVQSDVQMHEAIHPLSLPPFDAPIYLHWPIARNVFSPYRDDPRPVIGLLGHVHQGLELRTRRVLLTSTVVAAISPPVVVLAEKFSIHACMHGSPSHSTSRRKKTVSAQQRSDVAPALGREATRLLQHSMLLGVLQRPAIQQVLHTFVCVLVT